MNPTRYALLITGIVLVFCCGESSFAAMTSIDTVGVCLGALFIGLGAPGR